MPRSFSRRSAPAFVVFVDITGSPWLSLEAASEDRQETPAYFVAKPALHLRLHHHRPKCAPPSTCSTSPVRFRLWLGSGFQSPVCWNVLSGCAPRLIRWETLESNFQKWQSDPMANLDDVLIFVKVAQFEGISRATRSLGMPISTVSRRCSGVESKLGVSLLRRTTRRVTLTAQGREYFNQCREPLTLMEESERVLTLGQKTPQGMLRMSAPVILSQESVFDILS